MVAKISNFGMFKLSHPYQSESTVTMNVKGTPGYFAPENNGFFHLTTNGDVYAFGVVLFQMLCRSMPWERSYESSWYNLNNDYDLGNWAKQNVDPKIKGSISDDCLEIFIGIIGKSLKMNPKGRPNMDEW